MRIKLLLIDFDGTLVDTRQSNFCAYRDVLAEVGVTLDEETYLKDYFGMRCGEFMRLLGLTDSYQIDGLRRRKIDIYPKYFWSNNPQQISLGVRTVVPQSGWKGVDCIYGASKQHRECNEVL